MSGIINTPSTTADLTAALETVPGHLRPVILAVRDHQVGMLLVPQGADPFTIPTKPKRRAAVVIIGDDLERSLGPNGFHMPSIRRAIRACRAFAIVSGEATADVYGTMGAFAVGGRSVMIVETRLAHEFQWVALVQKLAPDSPMVISTVKGGRA